MPFITHKFNGQVTHYRDDDFSEPWTPSEVILIQHGFARHSTFWYGWIPILAKSYRVIRRDARGHGLSKVTGSGYTYSIDNILDEIIDTLNQLGVEKVHYLGESTGGIFGEFLAARNPERLLSLTICASPLYMPAFAQDMLAFGHSSWPAACREMGSRGWGEALVEVVGADKMPDKAFLEWWLNQIAVADGKELGDHAELLCDPSFDARRIMETIKVPMLLLTPGSSKLVDIEEQKQLHAAVDGSRIEIIRGFGHEIYIDQAEQCQQKFLAFIKDIH